MAEKLAPDNADKNAEQDANPVFEFHIQGSDSQTEAQSVVSSTTIQAPDAPLEPKESEQASTEVTEGEPVPQEQTDGEHALQTGWCFWYDRKVSGHTNVDEYKSHLRSLDAFHTVEGFWRYYVHLKRPSALEVNTNLYLFRQGENMVPMWESFPEGGCWILKLRKKSASGPSVLSKLWQDLVLATIGEAFEEPDVVGVGLSVRPREDLLSVWNGDNSNDQVRFMTGEKLKTILGLEENTMIEYKTFKASLQDMSSFRNAKPYVFAVQQSPAKH